MAILLCIETSGPVCSVSLIRDNESIGLLENVDTFQHAAVLTVLIDQLVKNAGITLTELSGVAISAGPGSYTGLRIGTSVAKGLCYALNIPLIALSTLEILASGLKKNRKIENGVICPMIDARRMEVYTACYSADMGKVSSQEAVILDEAFCQNQLKRGDVYFLGSGSEKFKDICQHPNAVFVVENHLSSKYMGDLAMHKYLEKDFEDVAYYEPNYLKEFYTPKKA